MDAFPAKLVFYDGDCGLCDRSVRWLLDHDRDGVFHFAPLGGETAGKALERFEPQLEGVDSLVLLERERDEEQVFIRSRAIFRLISLVPSRLRWLRGFGVLPRWLTDLGYRFVARIRKRVFGPPDSCRAPTPEERLRFLP